MLFPHLLQLALAEAMSKASLTKTLVISFLYVAVDRTSEIGLLKALGAPGRQIMRLFLSESAILSLMGAVVGLGLSAVGLFIMGRLFPAFPVAVPLWSLAAAVGVALATGLVFGVLPARRAARLDPVAALSRR